MKYQKRMQDCGENVCPIVILSRNHPTAVVSQGSRESWLGNERALALTGCGVGRVDSLERKCCLGNSNSNPWSKSSRAECLQIGRLWDFPKTESWKTSATSTCHSITKPKWSHHYLQTLSEHFFLCQVRDISRKINDGPRIEVWSWLSLDAWPSSWKINTEYRVMYRKVLNNHTESKDSQIMCIICGFVKV